MGKCKSLGLLKSFFSYSSQLSGAFSFRCHPITPAPQGSPWEMTEGCKITAIVLPGPLLSSEIPVWGLGSLMAVASLGWDHWWLWHPCLLIWQEMLHFQCCQNCLPSFRFQRNKWLLAFFGSWSHLSIFKASSGGMISSHTDPSDLLLFFLLLLLRTLVLPWFQPGILE